MKGEFIKELNLQIWHEIAMPDGGRIVDAWPTDQKNWPSQGAANRNVYRLDASNHVVWQVTRDDGEFLDWFAANQIARKHDAQSIGYLDPFWSMSTEFIERLNPDVQNPSAFSAERRYATFVPGRVVRLRTDRREYDLDPLTGIAVCNGKQIRW